MAEIPAILQGLANNQDPHAMTMAHEAIQQELAKDYGNTLGFLVQNFANESFPEGLRQQLGIYVKNIIHADDSKIKRERRDVWLASTPEIRRAIKEIFLQVLQSPFPIVSKVAAQIIGAYGGVEIGVQGSTDAWPELIPTLLANVTTPGVTSHIVANSLNSIGWVCECSEMTESEHPPLGPEDVNPILTMIINSLGGDRPEDIQCAALEALIHSVQFANANFENETERDAIINSITELLASPIVDVRTKAYECLTEIMQTQYDRMATYIPGIFAASGNTIATDSDEDVVKFALQLWTTIGEIEGEIIDDLVDQNIDPKAFHRDEDNTYLHLIEGSAETFVPFLLTQLGRVDADADPETIEDSVSQRVVDLLTHFQSICYDTYTRFAIEFIQASVQSTEVPIQYAYITALGLLSNPLQPEASYGLINSASQLLIQGLGSPHPVIRCQSAWSIAQVFRIYNSAFSTELLNTFIVSLAPMLQANPLEQPVVVKTVCMSFQELFLNSAFQTNKSEVLAPYVAGLMQSFYAASQSYVGSNEVQEQIFEAIADLISATPYSQTQVVVQTLNMTVLSLKTSLSQPFEDQSTDYRSSLIGTIGNCCKEIMLADQENNQNLLLTEIEGMGVAGDNVMSTLLQILTDTKLSNIHEESMFVFGYIASSLKGDFIRYCEGTPIFELAHANVRDYENDSMLSIVALGAAGDMFKAIELKLTHEVCDPFMEAVSSILMSSTVMRDVKPSAIAFCGDVCHANPELFLSRYAPLVIDIIQKAALSILITDESDEDYVDYISDLREQMMYVFAVIVDSLGTMNKQDTIEQQCNLMFTVICQISDDFLKHGEKFGDIFDDEVQGAVGLVGDVAKYMKQRSINFVFHPKVTSLLQHVEQVFAEQDADDRMKSILEYTKQQVLACRT